MNIEFKNINIKLQFEVNNEKKIKMIFFGGKENLILMPSSFVEAEISEENHFCKNPHKRINSYYSANCKYVNHIQKDNELIIFTKNDVLGIETHFIIYEGIAGLTVYNKVTNISNQIVHLEYISSFFLHGLGQEDNPACKDMNVIYCRNGWNTEFQWKKESFIDAGLFSLNNKRNENSFNIANTGSWSTKEYLPIIGVENVRTKNIILSQLENNGSWTLSIGDFLNKYAIDVAGPNYHRNEFVKVLKPNEYFISCKASTVIAKTEEESAQEFTKLRRKILKPSLDHEEMPIIFNDFMHGTWDLSKEELIKPLVDIAKEVGVDTFVMDAGWFAKESGWPDYIGEWKAYDENFPSGGLKGMFDYIHSKGLKAGLWFEIENMGEKCPIRHNFSKECFFRQNGHRSKRNQRYALNFAKKEVFSWAFQTVSNAIDEYHLDYIKLDYNFDAGKGNEIGSSSLGDGLLRHNRAVIRWIKTLQAKYPNLTIESCASGGQRMDYEMLKVCPITSSSDLEDYRYYPVIATNILGVCPPEVGAIWSYPVCNDTSKFEITDEVVACNMVNSMLGRVHLASKLYKLTPFQLELVKDAIKIQKEMKEFKKNSLPIFPKGYTKFFSSEAVAGLKYDNVIVLNVWNMLDKGSTITVDLSKYGVKTAEILYPNKLNTNFNFDKENGILTVNFDNGNSGRTFKLTY